MPTYARERLAGLMLDALDFGGPKQPARPKLKPSMDPNLLRGRAQGITEAGKRVAGNLRKLVGDIMQETREGKLFEMKDRTGKVENRTRTVDEILAEWRGTLKTAQIGGSIERNAKFMSQNKNRSDFESRVLSLYKALDGTIETKEASKSEVKRVRKDEMSLAALVGLFKRVTDNLGQIEQHTKAVKKRIDNGQRTKRAKDKDLQMLADAERELRDALAAAHESILAGKKV
jgi:hypothetical protein